MPKTITPKSQAKKNPNSCNTHFSTIFNPKKGTMEINRQF